MLLKGMQNDSGGFCEKYRGHEKSLAKVDIIKENIRLLTAIYEHLIKEHVKAVPMAMKDGDFLCRGTFWADAVDTDEYEDEESEHGAIESFDFDTEEEKNV